MTHHGSAVQGSCIEHQDMTGEEEMMEMAEVEMEEDRQEQQGLEEVQMTEATERS